MKKIVIYSGYNKGLGDLSFGRKLAEILQKSHPDAVITIITHPTTHNFNNDIQKDLPKFNEGAKYPVTQLDHYEQTQMSKA